MPARDELDALTEERAFVDLSSWRKVVVSGTDAVDWLHDLLTADIASLEPGVASRSLLLTPTGRVRADVHVARRDDDLVLLQPIDQPDHVGLLLGPYVVSSDVSLADATGELALLAVPGRAAAAVGVPATAPSVLGAGVDVLVAAGRPAWRAIEALVQSGLSEAGGDAVEAWRVGMGVPRMGADFDQGSLAVETGLDHVIDDAKGCFLGQESVAKIRNLGHPPTVLRHIAADGPLEPGADVFAGARAVGSVTSATSTGDRSRAIVRVRWEAATRALALRDGRALVPVATT